MLDHVRAEQVRVPQCVERRALREKQHEDAREEVPGMARRMAARHRDVRADQCRAANEHGGLPIPGGSEQMPGRHTRAQRETVAKMTIQTTSTKCQESETASLA